MSFEIKIMTSMTTRSMTTILCKQDTQGSFDLNILPPRVYRHYNEINLLFTDVDEEIDDEVAIHHACQISENATWIIICVPGASSKFNEYANASVQKRLQRFRTLFPHFERKETHEDACNIGWDMRYIKNDITKFYVGGPSMIEDCRFLSELGVLTHRDRCQYHDFPFKIYIDNLMQIAPLWHISPAYFETFKINKYIVMGDLENPESSINLTKAIGGKKQSVYSIEHDLLTQYEQQQFVLCENSKERLFISTEIARNIAMPYSLMASLPDTLRIPLLEKAFEQCVGRVPPDAVYANDISVVNHKTILNYCTPDQKEDILKNSGCNIIPLHIQIGIVKQLDKFWESVCVKDVHDLNYRRRLQDIAQAVFLITGVEYTVDGFTGFNAENLLNRELAEENWIEHVANNNSDLTPCYDLLALIVKYEGYVPDIDEFRRLVRSY